MTFLEKAKEEIAKLRLSTSGIPLICPSHLGLEDEGCPPKMSCEMCWNREMPNTETKAEILKEVHEHFGTEEADIGYVEGLEHSRNEVWEFVRKVFTFNCNDMYKIFGFREKRYVFDELDVQEALAKLKAYEEAQSKVVVGDIVECEGKTFAVSFIKGTTVSGMDSRGMFYCYGIDKCKKTGKHLELASILEQIGE